MTEQATTSSVNARKETTMIEKNIKAQIQSVTQKFSNSKLKDLNSDKPKKVSFKVSEANDEAWIEETIKKLNEKNGSMGAVTMKE